MMLAGAGFKRLAVYVLQLSISTVIDILPIITKNRKHFRYPSVAEWRDTVVRHAMESYSETERKKGLTDML